MIGAVFALALQTTAASAAAPPAPPPQNAADAIADILAQTPPDEPAVVAAPPRAPMPAQPAPPPKPVAPPPVQPVYIRPAPAPVNQAPAMPLPGAPAAPVAPSAPVRAAAPPPYEPESPGPDRAATYAAGVRSAFEAREARQGPLDGRWTLSDADGRELYMFQFADPGPGRGPVEGAWRDLDHQGGEASGFLAGADRSGQALVLRFEDGQARTVTLTLGADGRWTGRLQADDRSRAVVMTRS